MQTVKHKQCNLYIHYGDGLNDNISSVSFLWDDMEEIKLNDEILIYLKETCLNNHIYLFYKYGVLYPIDFKMKYYGLWKNICDKNEFKIKHGEEFSLTDKFSQIYYGFCEVFLHDINKILKILGGDSYLLISNRIYTLEDCKAYIRSDNNVDITDVVNKFCKMGEKVITVIKGCDGSSLNVFQNFNETLFLE